MARVAMDQTVSWVAAVFFASGIFVGIHYGTRACQRVDVGEMAAEKKLSELEQTHAKEKSASPPEENVGSAKDQESNDDQREEDRKGSGHTGSHWGYEGEIGPKVWGRLSPEFELCGSGKTQSPIDVSSAATHSNKKPLKFYYEEANVKLVNNGHTIQANVDDGNYIEVSDRRYKLAQFHFHAPSEHKLDGVPYNMEVHLVHKDDDGKIAVVGIFLEEGVGFKALDALWKVLPQRVDAESDEPVAFNPTRLLPKSKAYFSYQGSLTTPPCSEGVTWLVMREPVQISAQQVEQFTSLYKYNARPVQSRNSRSITLYGAE